MQSGFGVKDRVSLKEQKCLQWHTKYIGDNGNGETEESAYMVPQSSLEAKLHVIIHDWGTKQGHANRNFLVTYSSEALSEQRK